MEVEQQFDCGWEEVMEGMQQLDQGVRRGYK